jgi:hypothetical protein
MLGVLEFQNVIRSQLLQDHRLRNAMTIRLDLTDTLARFPIAYSWQPVRGWPVKHFDTVLNQSVQRTKQHALGEGPWDACEKLWTDAFEIQPADFHFHPGFGNDAPDIFFPSDAPHPWTSYISAKCREGLTDDQTDKLFGIYRTLRTPDYDGSGNQLNSAGVIVTPSDPRDEYFFKPNPANVAVDQILRWGKRLPEIVNFPAWIDWRDYNDELIPWDDSKYTPRSLSLTPTASGSLVPGTTYYIRVSAIRGGDETSASLKTLETKASSITLTGGQTSFQVSWLIKGDELEPPAPPTDQTKYRVYLGTVDGIWDGYFEVSGASSRTFSVTTFVGITAGIPRNLATSGFQRNIKRFECGPFFIPPYDLAQALDRICQISCADWQWSGLGTGTYRNDKIRFMSPANRAPVFTLNLAETGMGSFQTFPIDRRSRPNQIIVNFRDRDDEFLDEGVPVVLDREQLQEDDGQVKTHTIDGGTMYRSQAQRGASFYARVLCDMDQMASMIASPKSYHLLPGDTVFVTHETPDWTDVKFIARKKEENVEGKIGDPVSMQLYTDDLYSDVDYSPLPRSLPSPIIDLFDTPPVVISVTLSQKDNITSNGITTSIHGDVQFLGHFQTSQIGRVWIWRPSDSDYQPTHLTLVPDPITLQAAFDIPNVVPGLHRIKVVTESRLGSSLPFATHPSFSITIIAPAGPIPSGFSNSFDIANGNALNEWIGTSFPAAPTLEVYEWEARNTADTATIRGPVTITPALNTQMSETPPLVGLTFAGSIPIGQYSFVSPGGTTMTFFPDDHLTLKAWVQSKTEINLVGGFRIEFQIASNRIFPKYLSLALASDTIGVSAGIGQFFFFRMAPGVYDPQGINYLSAEGITPGYPVSPGDRLAIVVNPDGTVEYHVNYSPTSYPIYVSTHIADMSALHKVNILEPPSSSNSNIIQFGVDKLKWVRQGPEFMYTGDMQKEDNSGVLPASIRVRIRQKSFYTGGSFSAWVNGVFVR